MWAKGACGLAHWAAISLARLARSGLGWLMGVLAKLVAPAELGAPAKPVSSFYFISFHLNFPPLFLLYFSYDFYQI